MPSTKLTRVDWAILATAKDTLEVLDLSGNPALLNPFPNNDQSVIETHYNPKLRRNVTTTFVEDTLMLQQGHSTWWNADRSWYILRCTIIDLGYTYVVAASYRWEKNTNDCHGNFRTEMNVPREFWLNQNWVNMVGAPLPEEVAVTLAGTYCYVQPSCGVS